MALGVQIHLLLNRTLNQEFEGSEEQAVSQEQVRAYVDKTIGLKVCSSPTLRFTRPGVSETFGHLAKHNEPGKLQPRL